MPEGPTAAEYLLERMKALGVDVVFGNAGTDFPSIIEALASAPKSGRALPQPVLVTHETVAVGMAHGHFLANGRAQCVMVHVNVGLANALTGILNAATENVPILVCAGRTPFTEHGRAGSRSRPIHWGQEMRDQGGIVREAVKWDGELRYPEQAALVIDRALAIAHSDPVGPVYLGLPREVLAEPCPDPPPLPTRLAPARAGSPHPEAVAAAVDLIRTAAHPLIIAQRPVGDDDGRTLAAWAERFAVPVVDFWAPRNVMESGHPMYGGADPDPWLAEADVVIVIDALVPWLIGREKAGWHAKVVAVGADPLFTRTPMRSFPVDVALAGDPALGLAALAEGLSAAGADEDEAVARRRETIAERGRMRREAAAARAAGGAGPPMNPAFVSRCLSDAAGIEAIVFNELGCDPSVMRFPAAGRYFCAGLAGGLGWALPAALGYQFAKRDRLVIACTGDGSHIFANPVACHHVAMAQKLPVLSVIFNNGSWHAVRRATLAMYPEGEAAFANTMPFTDLSPSPDYAAVARAHGCHGEQVIDAEALPAAIDRALGAVRAERRPALLDVKVAPA